METPGTGLPPGYRLVEGPPPVADHLVLRERSGSTPRTAGQAAAALPGSWASCHVVEGATGAGVGTGRAVGGWSSHILDTAVLPEHQRRGLGDVVLTALLGRIGDRAPAGACVSLLADPPGRVLHARHGSTQTAPHPVGTPRHHRRDLRRWVARS